MSQFFASGGQNIGTLASVPVLPMNIQAWFLLGLTDLLSLLSKGLLEKKKLSFDYVNHCHQTDVSARYLPEGKHMAKQWFI